MEDAYQYFSGLKELVSEHIISTKQLLPTFPFLLNDGQLDYLSCPDSRNQWLIDLNSSAFLFENIGDIHDTSGKVKAFVFAGTNNQTLQTIDVKKRNCANNFYRDGRPISSYHFRTNSSGDGTVLTSSARLENVSYTEKNGEHRGLIKTFGEDLVHFMTGISLKKRDLHSNQNEIINELNIAIYGNAHILLADPNEKQSGIEPNQGVRKDEIPSATLSKNKMGMTLNIKNPVNGDYSVTLSNPYHEDSTIFISYIDKDKSIEKSYSMYSYGVPISFAFSVDSNSDDLLTNSKVPLPPQNLVAQISDSNLTKLSWSPSADLNVISYKVYSKFEDEPHFSFVQTIDEPYYDTVDSWAIDQSIKSKLYTVTSINTDGYESFFSNYVMNNDQDNDGVLDVEEVTNGTRIDKSDSDGEGLTDGEELLFETNPLEVDTDSDGFDDFIETQKNTDPINGNSYPLEGDVNGDNVVNLEDIILSLQILAEIPHEQPTNTANEVSGDLRIGLEEAVYGLREVVGD